MEIRISDICRESSVDGQGLRYVVFVQGCTHGCKGCHNPSTHDINGGTLVDIDDIINEFKSDRLVRGITISGGEPMLQPKQVLELAKRVKELGKSVWVYSGYTWEQLMSMNNSYINEILTTIDVLVDGKFVEELKSENCLYRGSSNQRLVNCKESAKYGTVKQFICS